MKTETFMFFAQIDSFLTMNSYILNTVISLQLLTFFKESFIGNFTRMLFYKLLQPLQDVKQHKFGCSFDVSS